MKVRLQAALLAKSMYLQGKISASQALDWMIVQHLSKDEKKAYFVLKSSTRPISSKEVAKTAGITMVKAAGLLSTLWENGLADRSEVVDGKLQYFIYTLAPADRVMLPISSMVLTEGPI